MPALSRQTITRRRGVDLDQLLGHDLADWQPVQLTVPQRYDLVEHWTRLMEDVYVHDDQKRALYGFDPVRALSALRRQIPALDSNGFLRELTLLINRLRDDHTQLFVAPQGGKLAEYVACLPFLVETYGDFTAPSYLVTKVSDDVGDADFVPGSELLTWNGVPFARAVDLFAETLTGGRPDSRQARALEVLTQRPLGYMPTPAELWVDIGYRKPDDPPDIRLRIASFVWRALRPSSTLQADDPVAMRARRGINLPREHARRARKLLFSPTAWQHDAAKRGSVARDGSLATTFPDAITARRVTTADGTFGYLRIWTFDEPHSDELAHEVQRLLSRLPTTGLIIDLRDNPGGYIETAERLLQVLTPEPIEPTRFACRASKAMVAMTAADANGPEFADWADSTSAAYELGEHYSQHLPMYQGNGPNRRRRFNGPVVAIVDANTFSCGDLFAAGLVDNDIATLVAVGQATGAGGANVLYDSDITQMYAAAKRPLPTLPAGISYSIAVRRMVRGGASQGRAIEDVGVSTYNQCAMTRADVLGNNADLIAYCTHLLVAQ